MGWIHPRRMRKSEKLSLFTERILNIYVFMGANKAHRNRKYLSSVLSQPDPFLNQSGYRKLETSQSQVLKMDQARKSAALRYFQLQGERQIQLWHRYINFFVCCYFLNYAVFSSDQLKSETSTLCQSPFLPPTNSPWIHQQHSQLLIHLMGIF